MSVSIPIWPGSSSFFPGDTPFGYYDYDSDFQMDADRIAIWCSKRLGYPIVDVELQDTNFYSCFEEAVTEYSAQVNQYRAKDNLLSLQGASRDLDMRNKLINSNMSSVINLAKDYGVASPSAGRTNAYTASFDLVAGKQIYDLTDMNVVSLETGSTVTDSITIKRLFHNPPPAIIRFMDPFIGTGMGSQQMLDSFGWGGYSPGVSFMMQPMFGDLLRLQAIEFNDQIRKSDFGFQISGKRIRIFPVPTTGDAGTRIWFDYTLDSETNNPISKSNVVSDISNAPFPKLTYSDINDPGKRWIQKYTLALAKEMLGMVRSKFSNIPIPDSDITLDGDSLRSEAQSEKEQLITELTTMLDATSNRALMEAKSQEAEYLEVTLNKIPRPIFIG